MAELVHHRERRAGDRVRRALRILRRAGEIIGADDDVDRGLGGVDPAEPADQAVVLRVEAQIAAEDAGTNNRAWGYWRQIGFLFGTMTLAVGLLFVTPTTEGPERWICLVMLTVILYSVYASNSVWSVTS